MGKWLRFKDLAQELGLFLVFKSSQVNPITRYFSTEQELFFPPWFGTFLNHQANIKNVDLDQHFQQKEDLKRRNHIKKNMKLIVIEYFIKPLYKKNKLSF